MLELSDHLVVGRADDTRRRAERAHVDRVLFARRDAGDLAARDALVKRFLPLARSLARRYDKGTEPLEDLVQVASLALVKAVDRFDPDQGALDTRDTPIPTLATTA